MQLPVLNVLGVEINKDAALGGGGKGKGVGNNDRALV